MKITKLVLGSIKSNCYIVEINDQTLIIDPGFPEPGLIKYLKDQNLNPTAIYITHGHFDHWGAIQLLQEHFPSIITYAPKGDRFWFMEGEQNRWNYVPRIDQWVSDGNELKISDVIFKIYETPGHSKGGTILYSKPHLFTGDTLFKQSVGRTDLPQASFSELQKSILKMYNTFPDETTCYPGHGLNTTIGFEKVYNPFVSINK